MDFVEILGRHNNEIIRYFNFFTLNFLN
jgi:hypothetical protein